MKGVLRGILSQGPVAEEPGGQVEGLPLATLDQHVEGIDVAAAGQLYVGLFLLRCHKPWGKRQTLRPF